MTTAKKFLERFSRRDIKMSPKDERKLHRLRDQDIAAIQKLPTITVSDIQELEWGGRFRVAVDFLTKCDDDARHALLHDAHHGVRSAAAMTMTALAKATDTPPGISRPLTPASILAMSLMNGRSRIVTTDGEKSVVEIEAMILTTHPRFAIEKAERTISRFLNGTLPADAEETLSLLRDAIKTIQQ